MKRPFDLFIAGTDTGVGKTVVTAALLAALRERGLDTVAMKPVQTGALRGRSPDLDFCAKAARWRADAAESADLCPYHFPLPASPHLAAREAGVKIEPRKITDAFRRLRSRHEAILVEGAGGVLVPLCEDFCQRDLIAALKLPVVVVARAGLGTLNHTLLTVEALRRRRIEIAMIVLSRARRGAATAIELENQKFLRRRLDPLPVIMLPFVQRSRFAAAGRILLAGLRG